MLVALAGCGRPAYPVAPVSGKVTCRGQPIRNASITFSPLGAANDPLPGKAADGAINDQGEFVLSTFKNQDGAIIGKHRVRISFNEANPKIACQLPTDLVLEVKENGNTFAIELDPTFKK
jgi:hypothetical protein